ncbi:MAG: winged helix-turn-helix transcriptional regulator [Novosphingobium sp.]|nr:winged helix-turn-helix transcriptional regulator [Novosphingobium sp.]MCP5401536.1 winged helix-turn-helix transcriptional regulator [Novosphingobium sp.]
MRDFRWLSFDTIPPACDLRKCGWRLVSRGRGASESVAIVRCSSLDTLGWVRFLIVHRPETRKRILVFGIGDGDMRAQLLRLGFGEVLGDAPKLNELEARASRLAEHADMLPRHRDFGALRLDLFTRDGYASGRPLGLHPREFALVWRLADTPEVPVDKETLLKEVWGLRHVPETNSLAVHVSRLRDKMRGAGLPELVRTTPSGGYVLDLPPRSPAPCAPAPLTRDSPMNGKIAFGNSGLTRGQLQ